jgi:hypothetical protein
VSTSLGTVLGLNQDFHSKINYVFALVNILIPYKATCFDFQEVIVRPFSGRKNKISVGVHMGSQCYKCCRNKLKIRLECKTVYVKAKLKLRNVPVGCGSGIWKNIVLPCCRRPLQHVLVVPDLGLRGTR